MFSPPEHTANYRQFFLERVASDRGFAQRYLSTLRRIDRYRARPTFNERVRVTGDYADELTVILFDDSGRKQFQSDLKQYIEIHQHAKTHLERHNRNQSKVNIAPEDMEYSSPAETGVNGHHTQERSASTIQQEYSQGKPPPSRDTNIAERHVSKEQFMERFRQANKL